MGQRCSSPLAAPPFGVTTYVQEDVARRYSTAVPGRRDHRGASGGALQVAYGRRANDSPLSMFFSRVINLSLPDTVDRADRTTIVTDIIRDNHSFLRADLSSPPDGGSRYVPLLYLPRVTWQGGSSLSGVPEFE